MFSPTPRAATPRRPALLGLVLLLVLLGALGNASAQLRQDDQGDTLQFVRRQPLSLDTVPRWRRIWGIGEHEFYIGATIQHLVIDSSFSRVPGWLDTNLGVHVVERRGDVSGLLEGATLPTVSGSGDTVWGRRVIGTVGLSDAMGFARELFFYPFDSSQSAYWWCGFKERSGGVSEISPYRDIWRDQKRITRYDSSNTTAGDTILKRLVFGYDPTLHTRRWPNDPNDEIDKGLEDAADGLARAREHPIFGLQGHPPSYFFGVQGHLYDPLGPYGARPINVGLNDTVLLVTIWCEVPGTNMHLPYRNASNVDSLSYSVAQQDTNYLYYSVPILKRDLLPDTTQVPINWNEFFEKTVAVDLFRIGNSGPGGPLHSFNSNGGHGGGRFDIRVVWTGKEPVALRAVVMRDTAGQLLVGNLGKGDSAFHQQVFQSIDQLMEGPHYGDLSSPGRAAAAARIDSMKQKLIRLYCGDEGYHTMFVGYNWVDTAISRRYSAAGKPEERGLRAWRAQAAPFHRSTWTLSSANENSYEQYSRNFGVNSDELTRLGLPAWPVTLPAIREHNGGRFEIPELNLNGNARSLLDTIDAYSLFQQRLSYGANVAGRNLWPYKPSLRGFGEAAFVSRRTGRPFIPWLGAFRVLNVLWNPDTPISANVKFAPLHEAAELRMLANLALCYGARGVQWYSLGAFYNEFRGKETTYPGGAVRHDMSTDWGAPGPFDGDTTNVLDTLILFEGSTYATRLYTFEIDSFYTGWGVMSKEIARMNKVWFPAQWQYMERLRWRSTYSAHYTAQQSYFNPSDTLAEHSRPFDSTEIVRSVRTVDRYGRVDSAEETFVEIGLFDPLPGADGYDTNHIYLVQRRTFDRPLDINPTSARGKLMDSLSEWRRVTVQLHMSHPDISSYNYVRVRQLAADTTRAPWDSLPRTPLDTVVNLDSAVSLWMRPGGGALLRITFLMPGDTLDGNLSYNNAKRIIFDGVGYHATFARFEENTTDTTSLNDEIWYVWSAPVVHDSADRPIRWSAPGSQRVGGDCPVSRTHILFGHVRAGVRRSCNLNMS